MTAPAAVDPFADLGPEVGVDPWEEPIPLESVALPPFPGDVLPPWLERYTRELATELQVPLDLTALLALGVCAACVSQRARICVRPRFVQPLNVWVLVPLRSGNRKSRAVEACTEPVLRWQKEQAEQMRDALAEGASRVRMAQLSTKRAEAAATNATDPTERLRAEADALELARVAAGMRVPSSPRLLAHDITAERLASLMAEHDERMAIIAPEGTIFALMSGRYSAGIPNIDIYKAGHAGDMFAVDREADRQGRPPIILERPAITLAISPQPDVVRKLTDKDEFRGEGLLARFLYSVPRSLVGQRQVAAPPVSDAALAAYDERIGALLALPQERDAQGKPLPRTLQCEQGARDLLEAFERELEPQLGPHGALDAVDDWGSKLAGETARFAGILHLAARAGDPDVTLRPVGAQTMQAAIRLARYFIPHALAAFALMGADGVRSDAAHLLGWIERWQERKDKEARGERRQLEESSLTSASGGAREDPNAERSAPNAKERDSFSRHDCWVGNRSSRFREAKSVDAPLALLCEHHYIRARAPAPDAPKGGRPASQVYDINPHTGSQNPQNPQNGATGEGFMRFVGFVGPSAHEKNGHGAAPGGPKEADLDDDSVEI